MNALEIQLKALAKLFAVAKVKYIILGGIAASIYGEPRFTYDVDANVELEGKDIKNFLSLASKFGFTPIPKNINSFIKKTGVIPLRFLKGKFEGKCDIIIAQNNIEHISLERGRKAKLGSANIILVSPEDLIIHKILSERSKDIEDAISVLTKQKGKLDKKYISNWVKLIEKSDKNFACPSRVKEYLQNC